MKNSEYHIRGEFKGHLECIVDIGSIKIWLRLRASKELIRNFINLINEIIHSRQHFIIFKCIQIYMFQLRFSATFYQNRL